VIDLSDALGVQTLAGVQLPEGNAVRQIVANTFLPQADRLDRRATTYRRSDKYDRIVGLVCYARALLWQEQSIGSVPTFTAWVTTYVLERGCHGIIQDSVHRLFSSLKSTITEFGDLPVRQLRNPS